MAANEQPPPNVVPIETLNEELAALFRGVLESGRPLRITMNGEPVLTVASLEEESDAVEIDWERESRIVAERLERSDPKDDIPLETALKDLRERHDL